MEKRSKALFQCASLLLGSATLFADVNFCPPNPCRVAACCPEIEDCCECNVCPPTSEITPNAGPCVKDGTNIYVTADFIYWTAREDNLEFAMTESTAATSGGTAHPSKGRVFRPETRWRPGFKIGAGHDFCYDGWDIYAEYTWYRVSNTRNSITASSNQVILDAFWFVNTPNNPAVNLFLEADGRWRLDFNVVDFEVGRNFYVSPRLMLRPFCGLKGTWQKQKLKVDFENFFSSFATNVFSMNNRMKIWGVGILFGLDTSWHLSRSISLFANLAASALWEQFKVNRFDNEFIPTTNVNSSLVNVMDRFHNVRPVLEWMLGARWETWFSCDQYHFAAEAGWEEQVWFSQNNFIRLPGTGSCHNGDLTFQGLTTKVRLDF
ncbi:MAG TPA: Lpg1974 family pore-forming outer membrane protein [Rhabdochlamydiaceae bacterium]|nr:Lpg1974 family pore-forming outer membrane protein [Rhabdochlamydiaceae bacterium]